MGTDQVQCHHQLKPMKHSEPFYCTACKEMGFFCSCYGCEICTVHTHLECAYPSPTVPHPLKENTILEFHAKGEAGSSEQQRTFCLACSRPLLGCFYSIVSSDSKDNGKFHPSCLLLQKSIQVKKEKLELKQDISSKCKWCHKKTRKWKKEDIPSWSYESKRFRFHVDCMKEMMIESWKKGKVQYSGGEKSGEGPAGLGLGGTTMSLKVILPPKPSSVVTKIAIKCVKACFNTVVSIATVDPTNLVGSCIWSATSRACKAAASLCKGDPFSTIEIAAIEPKCRD